MNPQNPNQRHQAGRLMAAVIFVASAIISCPSRATTPQQTRINDILGNSSELLIRRSGQRESSGIGSVLQRVRDALITAPPNNARALLRFLSADGRDLNMYIQTNSHSDPAIYYFPCTIQGGNYYIGWGMANNIERGCEKGIHVKTGKKVTVSQASLPSFLVASVQQWVQTPTRQVFYCSAVSENGTMGFMAASSGDPCKKAIEKCQTAGGVECQTGSTGSWWTSEKQLTATLDCGENQLFSAEGNGENMKSQVQTLLEQTQGQSCNLYVYRSQDFIIIPAPDDAVEELGDTEILVQTRDTKTGLEVDVLQGAINVRSSEKQDLQLVTEGERYIRSVSSSQVTRFNREEAINSVDLEVLCAFASHQDKNLNIAICQEENLIGLGDSPIAFCNVEQASGGQAGDKRMIQLSSNRGELKLEYEMYDVPDRIQVIYEGKELLDTGFVSGINRLSIPYEGRSGRMEVIVTGNQEIGTTEWNYTLRCP